LDTPAEVVTRAKIRQTLWPADTFVEFDDDLNNAVKKLRSALCDSPDNPRFIETGVVVLRVLSARRRSAESLPAQHLAFQ
jgi:DNA-binding response OmpR family regulator